MGYKFNPFTGNLDVVDGAPGLGLTAGGVVFSDGSTLAVDAAKFYWNDTNKTLVIGDSASTAGSDALVIRGTSEQANFTISEDSSSDLITFAVHRHSSTSGFGANITFAKSRGTSALPTAVVNGDTLFEQVIVGYDGTDYEIAAAVKVFSDGVVATDDVAGRIEFQAAFAGVLNTAFTIFSGGTNASSFFLSCDAGISSYDGLGGTDSEAYGAGATTSGLDNAISIGPRATNASSSTGNTISIGVDSDAANDGVTIGNGVVGKSMDTLIGNLITSATGNNIVIGSNGAGTFFDVMIGANAIDTGSGNNVGIGGGVTLSGGSNVVIGVSGNDGGFTNVVAIGGSLTGASAGPQATGNTILGFTSTDIYLGRPIHTGAAAITAKTVNFTGRTGTNRASYNVTWNLSPYGSGTGANGEAIFNTYVNTGLASGTTQHTQIERMRFKPLETVINENGNDIDWRCESDTDANCFVVNAGDNGGAGAVVVGAAATADSAKFYVSGKISGSGEFEINGDLNHDGTNIGFYGVAPVARPAAYTQTYATATRTHSNLTSATLTDSTGGTANTTVQDVTVLHDQTILNNNFADLTAQINALRVDLENVKQLLNSVIDDDQSQGLKQ